MNLLIKTHCESDTSREKAPGISAPIRPVCISTSLFGPCYYLS